MKNFYFTLLFVFGIAVGSRAQTATLIINEVNANITNSCDLIELFVKSGGSVGGFSIQQAIGTPVLLATFPTVTVSTGDLIVVHLNGAVATGSAPASETLGINQYPNAMFSANYDGAWDFMGGVTGMTYTNRVILVKDSAGAIQDAVPFSNGGATPVAFPPDLQSIQTQNLWLPVNCGGSPCDYVTTPTAQSVSVSWLGTGNSNIGNSVQRNSNTDHDNNSDWNNPLAQTWGLLNSGQTICISTSSTISANACSSYTSPSGNHIWTGSGTYNDIIPNVAGCDSTITINLTIKQTTSGNMNASICQGQNYLFNGLNRTTGGAYSDTLINAVGCDSILTLNLAVNNNTVSSFSQSICNGSSYLFNGQNLTAGGSYNDTLLNANGCDSIVTLTLSMNALPQPTVTRTLDTLSTQTFTSYQWLRNGSVINGAISQTLTLIQTGNYGVVVTDANGCRDTSVVLNVTTVEVRDLVEFYGVKLYPNPNNGNFVLEFTGDAAREVEITDAIGSIILSPVKVEKEKEFKLEAPAGIYFLNIKQDKVMKSLKFSLIK